MVGEKPYAEGLGDSAYLPLSQTDLGVIDRLRERGKKLVVILVSGRPIIVAGQLPITDAFVAAWLPGTEGQGVADVLFGDYPFTGKVPYTWPRSMGQLPFDFARLPTPGCEAPLFPFSYGLDARNSAPLALHEDGLQQPLTAASPAPLCPARILLGNSGRHASSRVAMIDRPADAVGGRPPSAIVAAGRHPRPRKQQGER